MISPLRSILYDLVNSSLRLPTDLRSLNYVRRCFVCCVAGSCKLKTSASAALIGRAKAYNLKCHLILTSKPYWFSKERLPSINGTIFDKTSSAIAWCEVARSLGDSLCAITAVDEFTLSFKGASRLLSLGRPSWQIVFISGRKRLPSHTLILATCVRHHYELGSSALIGLEY
ncbi:MAG: hypothetical protein ACTS6G_06090 [Candidatus Hodgkinia cicadicola]